MEAGRWSIAVLLLAVILGCCTAQNSNICQEASTCAECISISPQCAWCAQDTFVGVKCDTAENMTSTNCTDIQNPDPYAINVTKNESLSNAGDAPLGEAIQVQPQEVHLTIRRGETARINLNVRQAEDYPVDLYYLMDLSQSMAEDLEALRGLAGQIVETMQELTRNFRVGFGSFVDKVVIPFASIGSDGEPLLDCELGCELPYLFKNGLPLTNSTDLFETTLRATSYSTSQDSPEAGFDALLQVAVCHDEIGWRDSARHLVVFATDAPFHSAGDGRIGGIITPNDGECHVNPATGYYDDVNIMDYPSLGHLSRVIQDKDINVMFVVAADVERAYRDILSYIPGSQIGFLAADSTNILNQITDLYEKITEAVQLSVEVPDELLLEITSHCQGGISTPNSLECSGLAVGETVSFSIDVTAESCVEGGSTRFTVRPVGFSEEMLVHVDVICGCECEDKGIPNSPECNSNGIYQCGQCTCGAGSYGAQCQCSGDSSNVGDDRAMCIAPNSATVCSGRGECVCGECVCDPQRDTSHVVSGRYCQCDNFNCPFFEGELCGGPQRGHCECDPTTQQSKCFCTAEYTGDSCNCLRSQDNCIAPNGLICNAHGNCECGACKCDTDSPFKGSTCFDCATCSGQCEVYQECVQCAVYKSGPLNEQQCSMCNINIIVVTAFPDVDYKYNCSVPHTDNCSIVFVPHFADGEDNVPVIYVLDETVCPPLPPRKRVDVRWVAVGLAIFIVILGILFIILYKCYIMWLDRKEYQEWLKEKNNPQFSEGQNPLYVPASTKHQNPAYGMQISEEKTPMSPGDT